MSVTVELTNADEALLRERAAAAGLSESEYLLRLLHESGATPSAKRFDFPHIRFQFTEAAMKLDRTKNGWWEELEDDDAPSNGRPS